MTKGRPSPGDVAIAWWKESLVSDTGLARKTRAQLRRAITPVEALNIVGVHDLYRKLTEAGFDVRRFNEGPDKLALVATVLARVKTNQKEPLARIFGGNPALLSRIRFDAIIRTDSPRDLCRQLVRALHIVKDGANVRRLTNDLYWWNDRVRTDWCFDYHGASVAKPESDVKDNSK